MLYQCSYCVQSFPAFCAKCMSGKIDTKWVKPFANVQKIGQSSFLNEVIKNETRFEEHRFYITSRVLLLNLRLK